MAPGDFIITPSWAWHAHGNPGQALGGEAVVWLDCLDIPLVRSLDCGFAQSPLDAEQPVTRPEGSAKRAMVPTCFRFVTKCGATSPLFHYPYERSREALDSLLRQSEPDDWDGLKLRYVNPATGGWAMPTIGTACSCCHVVSTARPTGPATPQCSRWWKATGGPSLRARILILLPDTFVVPSWASLSLQAEQECVLFSCSDRPVQQVLGLLRESRENR